MAKRTQETVVRVVHNGYSQGTMTWGEAKLLASRHSAKITNINEKRTPNVVEIRGGTLQPKSG